MGRAAAAWSVVAVVLAAVVLPGLGCGGGGEGGSGPTMRPGQDCLACHGGGEAAFSAAGTVLGADGNAAPGLTVTLVDSLATQASATTNSVGNFYFEESLTPPFQVAITDGTTTVTMPDAHAACNSCHQGGGAAQAAIVFP
jgi:hypothetical protein